MIEKAECAKGKMTMGVTTTLVIWNLKKKFTHTFKEVRKCEWELKVLQEAKEKHKHTHTHIKEIRKSVTETGK